MDRPRAPRTIAGHQPVLWLLVAALLLSVSLAWSRSAITVRVLMPAPFADAVAPSVASFNRSHTFIRIAITRGPLETEAVSDLAIGSLLLGHSPYDLLLMDVTWTAKYAAVQWLLPLEDWLGPEPQAGLVAGAEAGTWIDGHLWRVPLVADMGLLYWRTDLMAHPPRTPEELVTISRSLQSRGKVRWGYVWQGRQYEGLSCVFLEVLRGFGGEWGMEAGSGMGLDRPPAMAAARWLRQLVEESITPPAVANHAEPEALQLFQAGDAAFLRTWPYAWRELQRPDSPVAGKVGITTMVARQGELPAATQGSWGLSVLRGTRHPEAAVTVLQALTGPATQRQLVKDWGYTPTLAAMFEDPDLVVAHPILPQLRTALALSVERPITPAYAQLSDILQRQLSGVITGDVSPEQGMARAGRGSRLLLESAGAVPMPEPA